MTRVTVWNEFRHEKHSDEVAEVYPDGIHTAIADGLEEYGFDTHTATLDDPEHGLTQGVLDDTDVLTWWGHRAHDEVADHIVERVHERVLDGMGLLVLHSGHYSKIFKKLMGTTCSLKWREAGEKERLWVVEPSHPIADGLDEQFQIPATETYGEPYDVPEPDRTVLVSWFEGGEVFRSGICYRRGRGRIFAFRPGHEEYPIFHQSEVKRVIHNAVEWAAPTEGASARWGETDPLESVDE